MKRIITLILALSMALSFATVAFAEETAEESYDAAYDDALPEENADDYYDGYDEYAYYDDYAEVGEELDEAEVGDPLYPEITGIATARGGLKLSWSAYPGAVRYRLFVKFNGSSWQVVADTEATSALHTGLSNGTEYTYTVRAIGADGYYSTDCNRAGWTQVYYDAPVLKNVTDNGATLVFAWNAQQGVELFRVYRKVNGGGWVSLANTTDTRYVDENVESGNKYTYTVRAMTPDGSQFASYFDPYGVTTTFASVPMITKFDNLDGCTRIYWSGSNGAVKYRAFVKATNGWARVGDTANTWIDHKNLTSNTEYTYTIRALDANGQYISDFYRQGWSNRYLVHPQLVSVESAYNGLKFVWKATPGAAKFRVYKKKGSSWSALGNATGTSFIDENVTPGETATYTVRCLSDDEKQFTSYFDRTGKTGTYVKAPEITSFQNTNTGTRINIKATNGAVKYRVFYKGTNGWNRVGDTAGTYIDHNNLTDGQEYIYTVRALGANGAYISAHNPEGWANIFFTPPKLLSVSPTSRGNLVEWESKTGASGYRLYRKPLGGDWTAVTDVGSAVAGDLNPPQDQPYTYTVRCLNAEGTAISGFISSNPYYVNGALANGTYNGCMFVDGYPRQGYVNVGGATYYYDSNGNLQKNGIVGTKKEGLCYADASGKVDYSFTGVAKNSDGYWYAIKGKVDLTYRGGVTYGGSDWNVEEGKATKVTTTKQRTLFRAFKLVAQVTKPSMTKEQKLRACFDHMVNNYTEKNPRIPHYTGMDWPEIYANDVFVNKMGNCMSFGAAFAYMAKAIGYTNVYCCHSGGHGWAEINGLVYDPEWSRHRHQYSYYALSYNTKTDQDYKGAISPGYAWMHIKI